MLQVDRLNIIEQLYSFGVDGIITDCEYRLVTTRADH